MPGPLPLFLHFPFLMELIQQNLTTPAIFCNVVPGGLLW